ARGTFNHTGGAAPHHAGERQGERQGRMSDAAPKLEPQTQTFRERRGVPAAPPKRLAHVVSVSGSRAVAMLERMPPGGRGEGARIEIGALIKVMTPAGAAVGWITSITMPMPSNEGE